MNMREKLASLSYRYDDFVRFAMQCIEMEKGVEEAIWEQFRIKPDSDTNDITKLLCEHLGIGEPVELVDEDEYESGYEDALIPVAGMRAAY